MTSLQEYRELVELMRPALWTAAAVGVAASCVGTFVLLRREGLLALALPQVVAAGAAAGFRLAPLGLPPALAALAARCGWPTLPPALAAVALAVAFLAWSKRRGGHHWMLPSLYVAGVAVSVLLVVNSGRHLADVQNLFTGIEVAVTDETARVTIPCSLAAGSVCALLWRRWLVLAQAPAAAEMAGLRPARWDALFMSLLAAVLLLGANALGTVMVLALLFLPPAAVLPWVKRIPVALAGSALLSLVLLGGGFVASKELDWPLSQSVAGAGFAVLLASHLLARLFG